MSNREIAYFPKREILTANKYFIGNQIPPIPCKMHDWMYLYKKIHKNDFKFLARTRRCFVPFWLYNIKITFFTYSIYAMHIWCKMQWHFIIKRIHCLNKIKNWYAAAFSYVRYYDDDRKCNENFVKQTNGLRWVKMSRIYDEIMRYFASQASSTKVYE